MLVEGDGPSIGDCNPVGIARQIRKYRCWTGKRALGIDHPLRLSHRRKPVGEGRRVSQLGVFPKELQLPGTMGLGEFFEEAPSKQPREHAYPHGLYGEEIPLEARIVAVADVFDALTSPRPYKPSWTIEEAFGWLRKLSRSKCDENCVDALLFNAKKVKEIQAQFQDPGIDPLPSGAHRSSPESAGT